jgi:uncharacterized YccA/Bax inhibitor family protein
MQIGRTANPALNANTFVGLPAAAHGDVMTVGGTVGKSTILLLILLIGASYTWDLHFSGARPEALMPWVWGGAGVGFVFALVTIFKKTWSPVTAPLYAAAEGVFLGAFSGYMESIFPGIVIQAVGLTFGTFLALLMAYQSGLIKATENFKLGVVAATGGVAIVYLVSMVMGFFGTTIPFIHDNGVVGIGFSLVVVVIAALNLVLDFDFIEQGAEHGAPKYMEWYASFGLLVTLIWLYLEMIRLLAKLRSRD